MTMVIDGTNGVQFPDSSIQTGAIGRNRIINGAMVIDQRNAGAAVTPSGSSYQVDRFFSNFSQASKFTIQQNAGSVTPPTGFSNYLGATVAATATVGSGDYFFIAQYIEGNNVADLGWGAAGASAVTLSFWVRSSVTGTFGGAVKGSNVLTYPFTYTISSANTWEQKTITVTGATTDTWPTNNTACVMVAFSLAMGSTRQGTAGAWASAGGVYSATGATNLVTTLGATFYITGVQLEKGSAASPFEYRQYGTELALCQRYFTKSFNPSNPASNPTYDSGYGYIDFITSATGTGPMYSPVFLPVEMRTLPTITLYDNTSPTPLSGKVYKGGSNKTGVVSPNGYRGFSAGTNDVTSTNELFFAYKADSEL